MPKEQDIFCVSCRVSLQAEGLVASSQEMEYLCCGYCKSLYSFSIDSSNGRALLVVRPLNLPEIDIQHIYSRLHWTRLRELLGRYSPEPKEQTKEVAVLTSTAIGVALSLDEWKKEIEEATSVADFLKRMGQ